MCRLLIQAHPNESRAHAVYGDFLNQDEKPNEALVEFKIARDLGAKEFVVYRSILYLYAQVQAWDSLIVESEEALTLFPDQQEVYLLNGIANSQKKKYAEAATAYRSYEKNNFVFVGAWHDCRRCR